VGQRCPSEEEILGLMDATLESIIGYVKWIETVGEHAVDKVHISGRVESRSMATSDGRQVALELCTFPATVAYRPSSRIFQCPTCQVIRELDGPCMSRYRHFKDSFPTVTWYEGQELKSKDVAVKGAPWGRYMKPDNSTPLDVDGDGITDRDETDPANSTTQAVRLAST